jgi:hypothetical protein
MVVISPAVIVTKAKQVAIVAPIKIKALSDPRNPNNITEVIIFIIVSLTVVRSPFSCGCFSPWQRLLFLLNLI